MNGYLVTRISADWITANEKPGFIIVEAGDGTKDPVRNSNLAAQIADARLLGAPLALHYTINARYYAEQVSHINDPSKWPDKNDPAIKDLSWALGIAGKDNIKFLIIACRQQDGLPSSAWTKVAQQHVISLAWDNWHIPYWAEFDANYLANADWDGGQLATYAANERDISMRQLQTAQLTDFDTFGLPDRLGCFWRYAQGNNGVVLYKYYGDLYDIIGWHTVSDDTEEPVEQPPTNTEYGGVVGGGAFQSAVLARLESIDAGLKQITGRG